MEGNKYGITLAKDYKASLASFKKAFQGIEYFRKIPHLDRDAALEVAYKELTAKPSKTKKDQSNGKLSSSPEKGEEVDSPKD